MIRLKGLVAVLIAAGVLSVPMYFYWEFLTRGMRPPESTLILTQLERTGIPDFSLRDLAGNQVARAEFADKVVLINVWATWCAPCVKEFPSLKRLAGQMSDHLVILAVSFDRDAEDVRAFVRAFGGLPPNFRVLLDPEKTTASLLGSDVLPETYIVSPGGKLVRKIAGETSWDDPAAIDFFRNLIR